MKVSILKTVYNKFNHINSELIQNIRNHLNFNNYAGKGILTRKSYPIHLLQQIGGTKREIKLKDGYKYEYHIDEIIPIDDKNNRICFFNIEESHDNCACLLYNTKKSGKTILRIEGIFNEKDCIKCIDKTHKYKIGRILMQIIIKLVKSSKEFSHITEIDISDTSNCYGLRLKYLRTIMSGEPYYAKYGFRPYENKAQEIFRYNRNLHKENTLLKNKLVDKIFENTIEMKNQNPYKIYVKKYKEYILKNNNPIDIKMLINKIISIGDNEKIDIDTKKNNYELLSYVIFPLYNALGYKDYDSNNGRSLSDIWVLKIR